MLNRKNREAAIGFIFFTLVLDITGLGLVIPVMPGIIDSMVGGDISDASRWGGWLTATYAILQFLFAPILGRLSDRYGRRPVLLFSLFGFALDYLLLYFAPNIWWFFIARAISGITGASITTASAYIADISTPQTRAKNFGMIGAAFGIGFILGPLLGGLLGSFGHKIPFLVAAGLTFINWLYGYFVLPESLPQAQRRPYSWSAAIPGKSLLSLKKYPGIGGLTIVYFLVFIAAHAVQSTWNFFTIERFQWTEWMIGISLGVVGAVTGFVQGVLVRYINPVLGNTRSVIIGYLLYAAGLLLFAFASESWMMYVFLIPYCLGGIANPALQSFISGSVPASEQGELQGSLTSIMSLTSIIGPPLMTGVFSYFTGKNAPVHFSGAAFLLGAVFMLLASLAAWILLRKRIVAPLTGTVQSAHENPSD